MRRVMEGDVPVGDLAVSKVLWRPLSSYDRAANALALAKTGREHGRYPTHY